MLIEFSVKNFKSFKEKQTLSMVAAKKDKSLSENLLAVKERGIKDTHLLKSSVIYGANASGKSNLLVALNFMVHFIVDSATKLRPNEDIGVPPFRLDEICEKSPSEFEIQFIYDSVRYQYGFSLDKTRVYEEWLYAYPAGKTQKWFHRHYVKEEKKYVWRFSTHLKGNKKSQREGTRDNNLFLSVAAQFNNAQITTIYNWMDEHLRFLSFPQEEVLGFTSKMLRENKKIQETISKLLNQVDTGIHNVEVIPDQIDIPKTIPESAKQMFLDEIKKRGDKFFKLSFSHSTGDKNKVVEFDINEESAGTVKFLEILGPWLYVIDRGYTLIVDELGAYLHTQLIYHLLKFFHNPEYNKNGAQLLFTTHDTTLMNYDLFRRDQIWFTEKNNDGASFLYPLTAYKPRNDESLQRGYLAGRYGATPLIEELTF